MREEKRQLKVWVVSPFANISEELSSDRYFYISAHLKARGLEVTQFVSSFDHYGKKRREAAVTSWTCVKVFEPGYRRNVSPARLMSHACFDLLISFYFLMQIFRGGKPDVIFVALPHNGAAFVSGIWAKLFRSRFVVDIHDTWPESLLGIVRVNPILCIVSFFWKALADAAILLSDSAFAESARYAERASSVRRKFGLSPAVPVYLGGDLDYYNRVVPSETLPEVIAGSEFLFAYVGSLGFNYDLDCVIAAFSQFFLDNRGAGLLLVGTGEREAELREKISALGLNVWVSGRVSHRSLVSYLKCAKVGLNAFRAGGNVAYSYKLNDYLLAGIPVINSLHGEVADLIMDSDLGFNYEAGNVDSLLEAMKSCFAKWKEEPGWSHRILEFAAQRLDRKIAYAPIVDACCMQSEA